MASFKFNFNGPLENEDKNNDEIIKWLESEKIEITNQHENLETIAKHAKMFLCGDIEIGHVSPSQAPIGESGDENPLELSKKEHSDLITGKYEGGLKIWECTYDLVEYLEDINIECDKKQVLDLGCGSGILGIYAFQKGALVTFQDYNKEVLNDFTIPNVLLNIDEDENRDEILRCQFYSGDWKSFEEILQKDQKYDIILTAETIYNVNNYDKLINIFENRLADNGTIYLAAKTYYFGVGGGTRQFEHALSKNGNFKYDIVWKTTSGIQREILKINRK